MHFFKFHIPTALRLIKNLGSNEKKIFRVYLRFEHPFLASIVPFLLKLTPSGDCVVQILTYFAFAFFEALDLQVLILGHFFAACLSDEIFQDLTNSFLDEVDDFPAASRLSHSEQFFQKYR